jgi:hypothetical protein
MIVVRGYAEGLLERAGKVIGTQFGERGELRQLFELHRDNAYDE